MSYRRVIPRDLFNEANLLKCYGQIFINLETVETPGIELEHDGEPFDVQQDMGSGDLYVANVKLVVRGTAIMLYRAFNSREPWPLYLTTENEDEVETFCGRWIVLRGHARLPERLTPLPQAPPSLRRFFRPGKEKPRRGAWVLSGTVLSGLLLQGEELPGLRALLLAKLFTRLGLRLPGATYVGLDTAILAPRRLHDTVLLCCHVSQPS